MITEDINRRAMDLVNREVQSCMSSLISTLAGPAGMFGAIDRDTMRQTLRRRGSSLTDLQNLADQACELTAPVPDYEEAAIQAGWEKKTFGQAIKWWLSTNDDGSRYVDKESSLRHLCEDHNIDPIDREVYEHWAVDSHLANDLIALGEKVDTDFAGLCVWARTTAGQAIHADDVIRRVVELRQRRYEDAIRPEAPAHA